MIQLVRSEAPGNITADGYQIMKDEVARHFLNSQQVRFDFNTKRMLALLEPFKLRLAELTSHKCSYCEQLIKPTSEDGVVDHYRPRSVYWWLSLDWENMLYACKTCSQEYKREFFPVAKDLHIRRLINEETTRLNYLEQPFFINPFLDNPTEHFIYVLHKEIGKVTLSPLTTRGARTIDEFGLNRPVLQEQRFRYFVACEEEIKERAGIPLFLREVLQRIVMPGAQFAGMLRYFLPNIIASLNDEKISREIASILTKMGPQLRGPVAAEEGVMDISFSFELSKIEICNFRSLSNFTFNIPPNQSHLSSFEFFGGKVGAPVIASWIAVLGENGIGKSSVIQAVVLAMLPIDDTIAYASDLAPILKMGEEKGYVRLTNSDGKVIEISFDNTGNITRKGQLLTNIVLAYGATRLLAKGALQPETGYKNFKVRNLFDYTVALVDAKSWLLKLDVEEFDKAALFLKDLLFLQSDFFRINGKIYTIIHNKQIELGLLSDGYKTLLALAVDIFRNFVELQRDVSFWDLRIHAVGIIIIDEIGTHLHPKWKMEIVSKLRHALPGVTFIMTTHEPLCLRGLQNNELAVLQRDETTNEVYQLENVPPIQGLRVDQLLTSPIFGLQSTIDPSVESLFKEYYQLLAIPENKRTDANLETITHLQQRLTDYNRLGESPRDQLFYFIIDQVLAKETRKKGGMRMMEEIQEDVRKQIEQILNEMTPLPDHDQGN